MKSAAISCIGLLLVGLLALGSVDAQGPGAGKNRNRGAAADRKQGADGKKRMKQQGGNAGVGQRFQGGAMEPNPPLIAQNMLATFDRDGDGSLNQAELEVAVAALLQQMRAFMVQAAGQGMGQGQGQMWQHQFQHAQRNGQFQAGQQGGRGQGPGPGGQRGGQRGGGAGKGGRGG